MFCCGFRSKKSIWRPKIDLKKKKKKKKKKRTYFGFGSFARVYISCPRFALSLRFPRVFLLFFYPFSIPLPYSPPLWSQNWGLTLPMVLTSKKENLDFACPQSGWLVFTLKNSISNTGRRGLIDRRVESSIDQTSILSWTFLKLKTNYP